MLHLVPVHMRSRLLQVLPADLTRGRRLLHTGRSLMPPCLWLSLQDSRAVSWVHSNSFASPADDFCIVTCVSGGGIDQLSGTYHVPGIVASVSHTVTSVALSEVDAVTLLVGEHLPTSHSQDTAGWRLGRPALTLANRASFPVRSERWRPPSSPRAQNSGE